VHVYNNLYLVRDAASFGYSIGLGYRSAVYSQNNAWQVPPGLPAGRLVRSYRGLVFEDRGSIVNGAPADVGALLMASQPALKLSSTLGWQPEPGPDIDPSDQVSARVRSGAGAGRLWTAP
jgi:pectate lyase